MGKFLKALKRADAETNELRDVYVVEILQYNDSGNVSQMAHRFFYTPTDARRYRVEIQRQLLKSMTRKRYTVELYMGAISEINDNSNID